MKSTVCFQRAWEGLRALCAQRQATSDKRQATSDKRQATSDKRQATSDKRQAKSNRFLVLSLFLSVHAFATPKTVRVDGSIFDATGIPLTANKDIQIKAYDASTGGSLLWTSDVYTAAVSAGRFTINMDAASGSTPSLVTQVGTRTSNQGIYFQIEVDSGAADGDMDSATVVLPRIRAKGTMFALSSAEADVLRGVTATTLEMNRLSGVTANVQSQINSLLGGSGDSLVSLTDAATISVDGSLGKTYSVTLGGPRLMGNPTNIQAGRLYTFIVKQDGTGGRHLNWDTKYKGTIPYPLNSVAISGATGTPIGNLTAGGGLSSGFDGNTAQIMGFGPYAASSALGYIGKDWGSGNEKIISSFKVHTCTNCGYTNGGTLVTFTLQGSQDNSSWTDVYTGTPFNNPGPGTSAVEVTSGITATTPYRYHRLVIDIDGGGGWPTLSELEFYENLPLASSVASYPFISDGTNLFYLADPALASSGGGSSSSGSSIDISGKLDRAGDTMTGDLGLAGSQTTASRVLILDSSRRVASSPVTDTELGYLSGVTSSSAAKLNSVSTSDLSRLAGVTAGVQSQINAIHTTVSGLPTNSTALLKGGDTMTGGLGLAYAAVTPSRFLMVDADRKVSTSANAVTDTEFGYLSGVTQAIQTQLNAKATAANHILKAGDTMTGDLGLAGSQATASRALVLDSSRRISSSATTDAELGYLSGVTSTVSKINSFTATEASYVSGVTSNIGAKINKFTSTEAGYLSGVTASIQTQLNSLAPMSLVGVTGNITASQDTAYYMNSGTLSGVTLPASCTTGHLLDVAGTPGAAGWRIYVPSGQYLMYSAGTPSTGSTVSAGYLQSLNAAASVRLRCIASGSWNVIASDGDYTGDYLTGISTFTSSGTLTIPSNVRLITIKAWGAGGGGGGGNGSAGGGGGGGAYATSVLDVVPGEVITIKVGTGGAGGATQRGGGGGGLSAVYTTRGTYVIAAGGGGGGGGRNVAGGGGGGAGFTTATAGVNGADTNGGGAAIMFAGGSGSTGAAGDGARGGSYMGGNGGGSGGGAGGLPGGGDGGGTGCGGGGGGGAGFMGGGGAGTCSTSNGGAGGGGGGISYGQSGNDGSAGSGATAGAAANTGDSDYGGGAGAGGAGGSSTSGSAGSAGRVVIRF